MNGAKLIMHLVVNTLLFPKQRFLVVRSSLNMNLMNPETYLGLTERVLQSEISERDAEKKVCLSIFIVTITLFENLIVNMVMKLQHSKLIHRIILFIFLYLAI